MKAGKRHNKAEREYHLQEWKKSGLTQVAYSREFGLILSTLRYWASQALKRPEQAGGSPFLPSRVSFLDSAPAQF